MAGAVRDSGIDWPSNATSPDIDTNRSDSNTTEYLHPFNYPAYKLEDIRFWQEHGFHNPAVDFQQGIPLQFTSFFNAAAASKFRADNQVHRQEDCTRT